MNKLFEEYLFQIALRNKTELSIKSVKAQTGIRLVSHVRPFNSNIFIKSSNFNTQSDIAIEFINGETLILDTKYKLLDINKPHWNIKNTDVYQILTYKLLNTKQGKSPKVALLYPQNEDELGQEFKLANMEHTFSAFTVNLHNDLTTVENQQFLVNRLKFAFDKIFTGFSRTGTSV